MVRRRGYSHISSALGCCDARRKSCMYAMRWLAAWLALLARPLSGARVVYECHDLEEQNPSAQSGPITRRLATLIDRTVMRHADGVVSLTHAFVGRPQCPTRCVPAWPGDRNPRCLRRRGILPAGPRRRALGTRARSCRVHVVYVGSTWKYRGIDRLIAAFAVSRETARCPSRARRWSPRRTGRSESGSAAARHRSSSTLCRRATTNDRRTVHGGGGCARARRYRLESQRKPAQTVRVCRLCPPDHPHRSTRIARSAAG